MIEQWRPWEEYIDEEGWGWTAGPANSERVAPAMAAEIKRLEAENKKHESGHTLMTQAIMIANLEAQNAALLRALNVVMPWASKAVADKEDSAIGKRALDCAWEAIANAKETT